MVTCIKVATHATNARRRVTLVHVDIAVTSFEPSRALTVIAVALVGAQPAIQARDIQTFVVIALAVDTSPPVDAIAEVAVVAVRVGV